MTQDFWNSRYSTEDFVYGLAPNRFLAEHVGAVRQGGRMLLPADGEGRNAVYLASRGFDVTSFDQSEVAVGKAKALAAKSGVRIAASVADAMTFDYAPGHYDAAALIFAHLPPPVRAHVHAGVVAALRPGGLVFVQAFRPEQLERNSGGPKDPSMLYDAAIFRQDFAACSEILLLESSLEVLDEGASHRGEGAVISLIARK
jgi:SAM-dependent methyltransferase